MLLINKLSLSASSFNVNNNNSSNNSSKRKRTSSMANIAPILQRIKRSFLNHHHITETNSFTARRSNTVQCCLSEKQEFINDDEKSILFSTGDTKYYALRLERSMNDHKYIQPVENWWSTTPPIQHNRSIMIC